MGVCIFTHWASCIYYVISQAIGFGSDGWVYHGDPGFWTAYLSCFYWALLTLTTIGSNLNPETSAEHIFCIACNLLGVLLFATVFGNIGAMINQVNAARTEFQNQVDSVKRYMELRQIDEELQNRVVKWFDYTWSNKQSTEDQEALACLPEKLRAEIAIHVHMETLRKVAIFQDCEPGLLVELVLKLRLQVFSPGDFICRKGDIGKEMYIVKRGRLKVVSEDGKKTFATLSAGSVFGEVSILNIAGNKTGNRRTASVKSVGYSDLFCLSKQNLWDALKEYPEAKKMLAETGKGILRKDKLLDEEAAILEEKKQETLNNKVEMIADAVENISKQLKNISASMQKHSTALKPVMEAEEPPIN
ncbi:hypothetical protein CHS0354_017454 [Potamilus streckersoni]|uniref:Cyclic nucleotide-binding domain-containing protein n=1 Tax=Potamilus streckersoni TaxID=2493646 RepID=A0AAE0VIB2_9BIVA|nr:hypothetical protein CHS0354_017454 [Potamilus streckersoni]